MQWYKTPLSHSEKKENDAEAVRAVNKNIRNEVCSCALKISTTETAAQQLQ